MIIVAMSRRAITKILVVDDEADITTIFKKGLELNGFEVDAFNDPEEALKAFQPGKYDILITDVKMQKMTGFDLYRQIKKIESNTRVAFMTAFEIYHDEFVKMFPDIDVRCFITKPATIDQLVKVVTEELPRKYDTEA
jgi:DNA-binding response OmpR family regulator